MERVADATLPKDESGTPGKKGDDAANRGIKRPLWVERPRGDNRPRGQTTEEWRKPTEEELKRNPKMRSDATIPATPTSLKSNELEIPPTPPAK